MKHKKERLATVLYNLLEEHPLCGRAAGELHAADRREDPGCAGNKTALPETACRLSVRWMRIMSLVKKMEMLFARIDAEDFHETVGGR